MKNWNLTGVFASMSEASTFMHNVFEQCNQFADKYQNKVAELDSENFVRCIREYAGLKSALYRVELYAFLLESTNQLDPTIGSWAQNISKQQSDAEFAIEFYTRELKFKDDWDWDMLSNLLTAGELSWLKKLRRFRLHVVASKNARKLFNEEATVHGYWHKMYDLLRASERFEIGTESYSQAEIIKLLNSSDPSTRHKAGKAMCKAFAKNNELYATVYNAMMEKNLIDFEWQNYDTPVHKANLENDIDAEDLKNLVETVMKNAPEISQRYYRLKAQLFGVSKISYWDRNAEPEMFKIGDGAEYTVEQARDLILREFRGFSDKFADVAAKFFDNEWIDYFPKEGKTSLSYCTEIPVDVNPFICLNFTGSSVNVTTMAHELGHGVHEYLSKKQGELGASKATAQAEIASIFAEMLVFHGMLQKAQTPEEKMRLLCRRIGDMILSSFRQIALHQFEAFAYQQRQQGHVSVSVLSEAFERFVSYPMGDAVDTAGIGSTWASIPHFFLDSPFYVYSYCFSLCVVNSLYEVYQSHSVPDFEEKYMQMLENGGVENYREALARFGIDASKPEFWQNGLNLIKQYVDELETLMHEHFSK